MLVISNVGYAVDLFPCADMSLLTLPADTDQTRGLARYAIDFLAGRFDPIGKRSLERVELFFIDSVVAGYSALAAGTNAPTILRDEARDYPAAPHQPGATVFGSSRRCRVEKAVLANCAAVREWDCNGTNFGYDPVRGQTAGEFGHNDFYPVVIAAAALCGWDGRQALRAMLLLDEIRGRLAQAFSLKTYKIDHVLHGAIASAVVYAAALGATADQIASALGLLVAHAVPFRAIRYGKQLSDSKGASAAISTEFALTSVHRAMRGFVGPADIFRNREAIFSLFARPAEEHSPFDLHLATGGDDFAIHEMHFKLGLYEHQSAGAIQALLDLLAMHPQLLTDPTACRTIEVTIYQPAYHIICDPYKRHPTTRQSADHSLFYILATLLRKAFALQTADWRTLMLLPTDYSEAALVDAQTQAWMSRIELRHGGAEYDQQYPAGIPTAVAINHATLGWLDSGMVLYPTGHARNTTAPLAELLSAKFTALAAPTVDDATAFIGRLSQLETRSPAEVAGIWSTPIRGVAD